MTYDEALERAERVGASKAGRMELLAVICKTLANLHAVNPALVYAGATKLGLDAKQVAALAVNDPVTLGNLMFV